MRFLLVAFVMCGATVVQAQSLQSQSLQSQSRDYTTPHDSRTEVPAAYRADAPVIVASNALVRLPAGRSVACYTIRSYDFALDGTRPDRVSPAGTSTCQLASKSHFKAAILR